MRYCIRVFGIDRAGAAGKGIVKVASDESRVWTDFRLLSGLTRATLLSFLLVGALLLCHHGLFAALHQLPGSMLSYHPTAEDISNLDDHGSKYDHEVGAGATWRRALPLLLYLTYRLLLLESQTRLAFSAPRLIGMSPLAVHLPEGPAPSLLRVFRL